MERKIQKTLAKNRDIAFILAMASLFSCAPAARFSNHIKVHNLRYVSAAHSRFVAGRSAREELAFAFKAELAEQTITMQASAPQTVAMQQIQRPQTIDSYIQGHQGPSVEEEFPASRLDQLDLLLVVDNSSSMAPYQQKLAAGLAPLLSHIANTDWHIVVTSTSALRRRNPSDPTRIDKFYGCPRINSQDPRDKAVITREDMLRNPEEVRAQFSWKVMVGENGDPVERGLLAASAGLNGDCGPHSQAWLRPTAHTAVLMLSDEENCGSDPDQNCDADPDADPKYFLDRAPQGTQFFALLHDHDRYAECPDSSYIRKPDDYRWLIEKTGGKEGNICVSDYAATLTEISRDLRPVVRKDYDLSYIPEPGSITLTVDGRPWPSNFQVEGRKLTLLDALPPGARSLKISYHHDGIPLLKKFPLSAAADPESLQVKVNGRSLESNRYSIVDDTVLLQDTPPERAQIELSYRLPMPLPQSFPLPKEAMPESVRTTVDGEAIEDFQIVGQDSYDVYFRKPPRDGVPVLFTFETATSRILKYDSLAFEPKQIDRITAYDKDTHEILAVTWDKGQLMFRHDDVRKNRKVDVIYALAPGIQQLVLELKQKPREGSLSILAAEEGRACVAAALKKDHTLSFPCPPQRLGELVISYDYISHIDQSFRMRGNFSDEALWLVKINGEETRQYQLNGSFVEFPDANFKPDTLVEIEVFEPVGS